jgi:hypothetical protein
MPDAFGGLIIGAVLGWIGKAFEHRSAAKRDRDNLLRAKYADFAATYGALIAHLRQWAGAEVAEQEMRAERKVKAAKMRAETLAIEIDKLDAIDRFENGIPNVDLNNVIRREFDEAMRADRETNKASAALELMDDDDERRDLIQKLLHPPLQLPGAPGVDLQVLLEGLQAREKRLEATVAAIGKSLRAGLTL